MFSSVLRLLVLVCGCLSLAIEAAACRYSVREVGFVDLDAAPYQVYLYLSSEMDESVTAAIRRTAQIELLHAPVIIEEVFASEGTEELSPGNIRIVSPEGQERTFAPSESKDAEAGYAQLFQGLVESPKRKEIADTLDTFCHVLLLEGADQAANNTARATAASAIAEITANMDKMDKPVEKTATLISVPHDQLAQEDILLWSLGLKVEDVSEPRIAVLFGRGRRLGGVLRGDRVTVDELVRVMALAGTSCECGLERKWMQGPMILMRWDRTLQKHIAKHLGFDPESPVVKTEISQILAKSGSGHGSGAKLNTMLAYTEHRGDVPDDTAEGEALLEDVPLDDGPIMAVEVDEEPEIEDVGIAGPTFESDMDLQPSALTSVVEETPSETPSRSGIGLILGIIVGINVVLLFVIWARAKRA